MTQTTPTATRLDPSMALAAARRLVTGTGAEREAAARRLVESAPTFGIRLDLAWAVLGSGDEDRVRQAALVVPGSGRTGMLFVSGPGDPRHFGSARTQEQELAAAVRAACEGVKDVLGKDIAVVQGLPAPSEHHAIAAYASAGMIHVGDLAYLRRPARLSLDDREPRDGRQREWPEGVTVETVAALGDAAGETALAAALDASYVDTMDCPKLCGLRDTRDVIASHRATGVYDPALWWIVRRDGHPEGCCLLSRCPEHASIELVYIGIGPKLRGLGIGRQLLRHAVTRAPTRDVREITCAVDRGNRPALRLYRELGFTEFAARAAFVKRAGSPGA